jgi:hypothetical protein
LRVKHLRLMRGREMVVLKILTSIMLVILIISLIYEFVTNDRETTAVETFVSLLIIVTLISAILSIWL